MGSSRSKQLENIREKRLIQRIVIAVIVGGIFFGSIVYFSGTTIESGIKYQKIEKSENKLDNLEILLNENMKTISYDSLTNEQKVNIEGIQSLLAGYKSSVVSDSLIQDLKTRIEKVKTYN